jgi:hypothetical protein
LRIGLLLAAGVAALASYMATANVFAERYPLLVLRIAPHNADALTQVMDMALGEKGLAQKARPEWAVNARTALRAAPLTPAAVRTLGLVAETAGDGAKAKTLMLLAERLSRRDLPAQLWLTIDAAKHNDAHRTLAHIDTALSTEREAAPIFYAILARILADPRISHEFASLVRQNRPWLPSFLSYADENKLDPVVLESVLIEAGGLPKGREYHSYETDVVWRLVGAGRPDKAAELLFRLGRANPALLADGTVSDKTLNLDLGPFAWTTSVDPDVSSSFDSERSVSARAAPGRVGMILQRNMALPAGAYSVSARAQLVSEDAPASIAVEISCVEGSESLLHSARAEVPPQGATIDTAFEVSPTCPQQRVRFTATGGENQIDSELSLSNVVLRRAGAIPLSHDTDVQRKSR